VLPTADATPSFGNLTNPELDPPHTLGHSQQNSGLVRPRFSPDLAGFAFNTRAFAQQMNALSFDGSDFTTNDDPYNNTASSGSQRVTSNSQGRINVNNSMPAGFTNQSQAAPHHRRRNTLDDPAEPSLGTQRSQIQPQFHSSPSTGTSGYSTTQDNAPAFPTTPRPQRVHANRNDIGFQQVQGNASAQSYRSLSGTQSYDSLSSYQTYHLPPGHQSYGSPSGYHEGRSMRAGTSTYPDPEDSLAHSRQTAPTPQQPPVANAAQSSVPNYGFQFLEWNHAEAFRFQYDRTHFMRDGQRIPNATVPHPSAYRQYVAELFNCMYNVQEAKDNEAVIKPWRAGGDRHKDDNPTLVEVACWKLLVSCQA
jgi:hypothetical protein